MTALVTGANGFIGSAVVRCLLAEGLSVRGFIRASSDQRNLTGLKIDIVYGDLCDQASVDAALAGCETVFHVAADYRLWAPRPIEIYRANVGGTRHLMEAALRRGVRTVVHTSSVATLRPSADGSPATEESNACAEEMIGHYKRSKFLAEQLVRQMVETRGLPAVIVNPTAPVGPGDRRPTPTGRMVLDAVLGRMPAYVDTGLNIVHVDDVARGHLLAARHGRAGRRYILGGTNMSLREILVEIARLTGRPAPRIRLPVRLLMPLAGAAEGWARLTGREPRLCRDSLRLASQRMYFSSDRASRELGYGPRPSAEALADAVRWFVEEVISVDG